MIKYTNARYARKYYHSKNKRAIVFQEYRTDGYSFSSFSFSDYYCYGVFYQATSRIYKSLNKESKHIGDIL
jgi:hypothetical protein